MIFFKRLLRGLGIAALVLVPLLGIYLGHLDKKIRTKFGDKGKRWDIPAKVYANPLDLYVGYPLTVKEFEDLLQQLHYRRDDQLSSEGSYQTDHQQVLLKSRSFTFWDGMQESLHLKIEFAGDTISQITDMDYLKKLAIVRMDPVQIGSFYPKLKEDRILIKLSDAPDLLKKGLLATEDRGFYQHYGISMRGLARAILANVKAGGLVQGGSTITQQLVKNFYLTSERTLKRKINEVFMALLLEFHYSKDDILEAYLNEIYLGQDGSSSINGFGLASEFYFDRPLKSLELHQIAALVTLVRGPSYYDPKRYPNHALDRRNLVLDEMQQQNLISLAQATEAKNQPLGVVPNAHRSVNRYPAFLDLIKRQLDHDYKEPDLTTEGLKIFTTLDTQVQNILEKAVAKKLATLEKGRFTKNIEAAAIVTKRGDGGIVAMVGGKNPLEPGFNRALDAVRPIGSLMKPAVYLTALSQPEKYTLNTLIEDSALEVERWSPKNYDHQEHGNVPLHSALAHSYNLATVRIGMDVGLNAVAETLTHLGVERQLQWLPSSLLGAAELTPFEVTQMYQTLADEGFITQLRAIREVVAGNGKLLKRNPLSTKKTLDPAAVYLTDTILQEVVRDGTAKAAAKAMPNLALAGKTGTTNDLKDSWFAGFSGDYLSVVWLGRDDNKPAGLTGATGALQVWISLMKQIASQPVKLTVPENIEQILIDTATGLLANADCPSAKKSPYIVGSAPTEASDCSSAVEKLTADETTVDENPLIIQPDTAQPEMSLPPPENPPPAKSWFDNLL